MADMETPKPMTSGKKEEKKGALPTLKDTTQTIRNPAFKVRDLSARTFVDRLKQFRKKDLAFILTGLGVLFAAPLAERYLMSPTHGASDVFKEGWGFRPGVGGLGSGGSPFDTGENGLSPGSQLGENGDIITPANFRDPSSLILGPEAEAQPPATTSSEAPPASSGSNWKNALADAGGKAARAALGNAGFPKPPLILSKNMLSGLAGLSSGGGEGVHYSLPPISGRNVPSAPNVSNSLGAVNPNSNFKGVARSLTGLGAGSPESLKTAGANAASQFGNSNAAQGLQNAAAVQMPTANPNPFGSGGSDKNAGQDSAKQAKNLGESLAFMAAKQNMQKSIDLQWKLAEKNAMMWPNIKEKLLTDMITKPMGAVEDAMGGALASLFGGPSANKYNCTGTSPANNIKAFECADENDCAGSSKKQMCFCSNGGDIYDASIIVHGGCSPVSDTSGSGNGSGGTGKNGGELESGTPAIGPAADSLASVVKNDCGSNDGGGATQSNVLGADCAAEKAFCDAATNAVKTLDGGSPNPACPK